MYTIDALIERTMKSNNCITGHWNATYWNKLCVFCQVSTSLFTQHKNRLRIRLRIKRFEFKIFRAILAKYGWQRAIADSKSLGGGNTQRPVLFFFLVGGGGGLGCPLCRCWTNCLARYPVGLKLDIAAPCSLLSLLLQFPLWSSNLPQNNIVSIHWAAIKFFLSLRWESSADIIASHLGLEISNLAFSPIACQLIPLSIQCQLVFQYH